MMRLLTEIGSTIDPTAAPEDATLVMIARFRLYQCETQAMEGLHMYKQEGMEEAVLSILPVYQSRTKPKHKPLR